MLKRLFPRCDLDSLYVGGSESKQLRNNLISLKQDVERLRVELESNSELNWIETIHKIQDLLIRVRNKRFFINCLNAQNTKDIKAKQLFTEISQINSAFNILLNQFDYRLANIPQINWKKLLSNQEIQPLAYNLEERRKRVKNKLSKNQEDIINQLIPNGYRGWEQMYNSIVESIKIPFKEQELTVGQAHNNLLSGNNNIRKNMSEHWEKAWDGKKDLIANVLNHLAGFRLDIYKQRGWNNILFEPLEMNRMQIGTLQSMWKAIDQNKDDLLEYIEIKCKLLKVNSLTFHDFNAPMQMNDSRFTFEEAANFVLDKFASFSGNMAKFAKIAFENRWIEAENRPNKKPGAFCSPLPRMKQSRIFLTFVGTPNNVIALAHELGHGYHQYVIRNMQPFTQLYSMNVGETAATFSEMIVADAAIKHAKSRYEKIILLENKVNRGMRLLLTTYSYFLFEKRFYEERKKGFVHSNRLNEVMIQVQKEVFQDKLSAYDPIAWASRPHFYMTGIPFYNFPYTFGYLLSYGIYDYVQRYQHNFERVYENFLQDMGRMNVEDLTMTHFNFDITKVETWDRFVRLLIGDLKELYTLISESL